MIKILILWKSTNFDTALEVEIEWYRSIFFDSRLWNCQNFDSMKINRIRHHTKLKSNGIEISIYWFLCIDWVRIDKIRYFEIQTSIFLDSALHSKNRFLENRPNSTFQEIKIETSNHWFRYVDSVRINKIWYIEIQIPIFLDSRLQNDQNFEKFVPWKSTKFNISRNRNRNMKLPISMHRLSDNQTNSIHQDTNIDIFRFIPLINSKFQFCIFYKFDFIKIDDCWKISVHNFLILKIKSILYKNRRIDKRNLNIFYNRYIDMN